MQRTQQDTVGSDVSDDLSSQDQKGGDDQPLSLNALQL